MNIRRRHLDEFQRAEIGLKMDKMAREIAEETGDFTSETGREAASKRYMPVPSVSGDTHGMDCEAEGGSGGRQPDYGAGGAGGRNDEAIRTKVITRDSC